MLWNDSWLLSAPIYRDCVALAYEPLLFRRDEDEASVAGHVKLKVLSDVGGLHDGAHYRYAGVGYAKMKTLTEAAFLAWE
jgi:hypothetical protein